MVAIRWSINASIDIENIAAYISKYFPNKVYAIIGGILNKIEQLKQFPKMGRKYPERNDEKIREIFYKKYRILYEIRDPFIEIILVAHGSKLIEF